MITRIDPDNEFWFTPNAGAPKWPFRYVILNNKKIIADSHVTHHINHFEGKAWAVGVYVEPKYRRKGYGKGVVSQVMKEIFGKEV